MSETLTVSDVTIGHHTLSVTTRDCGDTVEMMQELTYRTIKAWLWIVGKLEQNDYTLPLTDDGDVLGSVEDRLSSEVNDIDGNIFTENEGDSRVTVWDTFKSQSRIGFHLNSDDIPQIAVNTWLANHQALDRILKEYPQNASQSRVESSNSSATAPQATTTPNAANSASTAQFVEGAIFANTRPDSRKVQYADGQLLIYNINRIVASTFKTKVDNKTVPIIELYSPFSTQHPTLKVYIYKNNSQELSPQWLSIKDIVEPLNLGALKPEATGNWQATAKVSHVEKDGKTVEYYNTISLKSI